MLKAVHYSKEHTNIKAIIKLTALLAVPVAFILVPTKVIESGPTICIWKIITGIPCPTCGTTRSVSCIFHLDFVKAWEYNKLIIITLPLVSFFYLKSVKSNLYLLSKYYGRQQS